MSSIPLPALDIRGPQQQSDPVEQYARLLQLKNQMQNQPLQNQILQQAAQSGQIGLQKQQQDLKDQQGIASWYKNLDPNDPNAFNPISVGKSLQSQGVSGNGILSVQGKILDQRKSLAGLTKDEIANKQELSNNLYSGLDSIIGETDPAKRTQALTPLIQSAAQNGIIQPQQAQQILSNPGAITDDQLKTFQKGLGISAAFLKSAASSKEADTTQKKLDASMNPQSSLYAPSVASVSLGTAPGAAQIQANEVKQAARKAGAEESARMPGEMALAAQRQALSQGDPNAAGQLLASGDATLSELKSRGATPDFIARSLFAAKRLNPSYNPQQAEAQFDVAKSPDNVKFFGSSKSLTDKGGTLDQLQQAAKDIPANQLPVLNSLADWEKAATGNGPVAKYAALALGVADDYSKVMGGGQGSDASRTQALNLIGAKASPEQRAASIEGIRGAVGSQQTSRIGSNPVLQRMYGSAPASSGAGITVIAPDRSSHTFKDQASADKFKKLAGIQ
jgi:hypothetical protein